MSQKIRLRRLMVIVIVALSASVAQASIIIETVGVGHAGNADDTYKSGYGGVDYVYNIGKYEVTAGQYTAFLNSVAQTDTYNLYNTEMWSHADGCKIDRHNDSGSYTYSVASELASLPVNFVSWGDAARFANWQHNTLTGNTEDGAYTLNGAVSHEALAVIERNGGAKWAIPTEDEWYKAAFHKNDATNNYFDYPTSSDIAPGCDMTEITNTGNNANYLTGPYPAYTLTSVGEFEESVSPYGTFDQGGNVLEWNEGITDAVYLYRSIRGGAFNTTYAPSLSVSGRRGENATYEYEFYGFRVVNVTPVPEPGSIALLICGLMAGLTCWRRRP